MNYEYVNEIHVPQEYKQFILPQDRIALFRNFLENFAVFLPSLKKVYAFLNFDSTLPIDYLIIYEGVNKNNGTGIILWDCPYLYSNKTMPAYRYIAANNMYQQFFQFMSDSMPRMEYAKFIELIPSNLCGLSFDKSSDKYWKDPNNAMTLAKTLSDLSMEYRPPIGSPSVKIRFNREDRRKYNEFLKKNENNNG